MNLRWLTFVDAAMRTADKQRSAPLCLQSTRNGFRDLGESNSAPTRERNWLIDQLLSGWEDSELRLKI